MEQLRVGLIDLRDGFQQHQADIQQDQTGDKVLDQPLQVAFHIGVQQERIEATAKAGARGVI